MKKFPFIILLFSTVAAHPQKSHRPVHFSLENPFNFIPPQAISFLEKTPLFEGPSFKSKQKGVFSPHTPSSLGTKHLKTHGFLKTKKGWAPFDFIGKKTFFLSEKQAISSASLEGKLLQAVFSYISSTYWAFQVQEIKSQNLLFKHSLLKNRALHKGTQASLFDLVLYQPGYTVVPTIGWLIAFEHSARLFIPYYKKKSFCMWHEGFACFPLKNKSSLIFQYHDDSTLDIWQIHNIRGRKNAPYKTIKIPYIIRLVFRKNQPPLRQVITPPNDIKLWPEEAKIFFNAAEKYIASLMYQLPILRSSSQAELTKKSRDKELQDILLSVWSAIPSNFSTCKLPRWMQSQTPR